MDSTSDALFRAMGALISCSIKEGKETCEKHYYFSEDKVKDALSAVKSVLAAEAKPVGLLLSRGEFHDKVWALYRAKKFHNRDLTKVNIYTIRAVFNAVYDAISDLMDAEMVAGAVHKLLEPAAYGNNLGTHLACVYLAPKGVLPHWMHDMTPLYE